MKIQTNQRVIAVGSNFSGTPFNLAMPYMRVQAIKYGLSAQLCYIGASFTPLNMSYNPQMMMNYGMPQMMGMDMYE